MKYVKKSLLLISALIILVGCKEDPGAELNGRIKMIPKEGITSISTARVLTNGNFILAGTRENTPFLMEVSPSGKLEHFTEFEWVSPGNINTISEGLNGEICIAGFTSAIHEQVDRTHCFTIIVNNQHDSIFGARFRYFQYNQVTALYTTPDNYLLTFYISEWYRDPSSHRLDLKLNMNTFLGVDSKITKPTGNVYDFVTSVTPTASAGYYLWAQTGPHYSLYPTVYKIISSFNTLGKWSFPQYSNAGISDEEDQMMLPMYAIKDGDNQVMGKYSSSSNGMVYMDVVQFDKDFNVNWDKKVSGSKNALFKNIAPFRDGYLVMGSSSDKDFISIKDFKGKFYLTALDRSGQTLWETELGDNLSLQAIISCNDNGQSIDVIGYTEAMLGRYSIVTFRLNYNGELID